MRGYREVSKGAYCVVIMADDVAASLNDDAPAKDRGRCLVMLKRLADDGPQFFNKEQFRMEGRYPAASPGDADVAVYALKSYQVRIYGGYRDRMFLCVEYDRKKKNKADQRKLKSAAKKISAPVRKKQ